MPTGHYRFRRSLGNVSSQFRGARPDTYPLFTGILDTYPGAAAAYSLRALTSGWLAGDVVEVRRSSDSTTQDFTASQINNGALLSFCNHDTTDLYNSARYFNGTSTQVSISSYTFEDGETISCDFLIDGSSSNNVLFGSASAYIRSDASSAITIRTGGISYNFGSSLSAGLHTFSATKSGGDIEVTVDGVSLGSQTIPDVIIVLMGRFGSAYLGGAMLDVTLGTSHAYTGLGTSVTAWEDTIGSNDGTETDGASYTGQGFDGFVSTWYDQSGNANDATQATTTAQPKIVDAGSLVTGGLDFDGVDDSLDIPTDLITSIDAASNFVVAKLDSTAGSTVANALSRNNPDKRFYSPFLTGGSVYQGYGTSTTAISHGVADLNDHLYSCVAGSTTVEAFLDGFSSGSVASVSGKNALVSGGIGAINITNMWNGKIAEIIVYASDQSANRAGIETNIQEAYPSLP